VEEIANRKATTVQHSAVDHKRNENAVAGVRRLKLLVVRNLSLLRLRK